MVVSKKNATLIVVVRFPPLQTAEKVLGVMLTLPNLCLFWNYAGTMKLEVNQPKLKEPLATSGGTLVENSRSCMTSQGSQTTQKTI